MFRLGESCENMRWIITEFKRLLHSSVNMTTLENLEWNTIVWLWFSTRIYCIHIRSTWNFHNIGFLGKWCRFNAGTKEKSNENLSRTKYNFIRQSSEHITLCIKTFSTSNTNIRRISYTLQSKYCFKTHELAQFTECKQELFTTKIYFIQMNSVLQYHQRKTRAEF